ncbi:MAG: hypothetical protein LBF23_01330 [Endomicrobium sp.]|jgi:hypothetical protein|nr:hypothetical protein [Endomicrobium sp.]
MKNIIKDWILIADDDMETALDLIDGDVVHARICAFFVPASDRKIF